MPICELKRPRRRQNPTRPSSRLRGALLLFFSIVPCSWRRNIDNHLSCSTRLYWSGVCVPPPAWNFIPSCAVFGLLLNILAVTVAHTLSSGERFCLLRLFPPFFHTLGGTKLRYMYLVEARRVKARSGCSNVFCSSAQCVLSPPLSVSPPPTRIFVLHSSALDSPGTAFAWASLSLLLSPRPPPPPRFAYYSSSVAAAFAGLSCEPSRPWPAPVALAIES